LASTGKAEAFFRWFVPMAMVFAIFYFMSSYEQAAPQTRRARSWWTPEGERPDSPPAGNLRPGHEHREQRCSSRSRQKSLIKVLRADIGGYQGQAAGLVKKKNGADESIENHMSNLSREGRHTRRLRRLLGLGVYPIMASRLSPARAGLADGKAAQARARPEGRRQLCSESRPTMRLGCDRRAGHGSGLRERAEDAQHPGRQHATHATDGTHFSNVDGRAAGRMRDRTAAKRGPGQLPRSAGQAGG